MATNEKWHGNGLQINKRNITDTQQENLLFNTMNHGKNFGMRVWLEISHTVTKIQLKASKKNLADP